MMKKFFIWFFVILIIGTVCFIMYDMISAYQIEKETDDISHGAWGALFRLIFFSLIFVSEIDLFHGTLFLTEKQRKQMRLAWVLNLISMAASGTVFTIAWTAYLDSRITNPMEIAVFSALAVGIVARGIYGWARYVQAESSEENLCA